MTVQTRLICDSPFSFCVKMTRIELLEWPETTLKTSSHLNELCFDLTMKK